jgi:hypothetical protein
MTRRSSKLVDKERRRRLQAEQKRRAREARLARRRARQTRPQDDPSITLGGSPAPEDGLMGTEVPSVRDNVL